MHKRLLYGVFFLLVSAGGFAQELDIFQADSIYAKNKIAIRTMYLVQNNKKQKYLVTYYNPKGQITKQYWYWNGDQNYHNVETFLYGSTGLLTTLIDSFANGKVERTTFNYEGAELKWRLTLDQQNDTCNYRYYSNANTCIQTWYAAGAPYRVDTTIFERANVKKYYNGHESRDNSSWKYEYFNKFDANGNLTEVYMEAPMRSNKVYSYDNRNLLIKKEEQMLFGAKPTVVAVYNFEYK